MSPFRPVALILVILSRDIAAQDNGQPAASRAGRRAMLPVADEILLARSAAPRSVSANARVLMLTDTGHVVIAEGSSEVTCVVNRSWDRSVEPHCYDPEGAASVMLLELRRNLLRHLARSEADIDADLADGRRRGIYRLPSRPAVTYMMSARQVLYDGSGRLVGKWRPHLMIYFPNLTNAAVGLPTVPDMRIGTVNGEGSAESNLMIIMPAFADSIPPRP
jgi:hypothetical protein